MTNGAFAVKLLACFGVYQLLKWMALLPFLLTGVKPKDFVNHLMNDDFRKLAGRN